MKRVREVLPEWLVVMNTQQQQEQQQQEGGDVKMSDTSSGITSPVSNDESLGVSLQEKGKQLSIESVKTLDHLDDLKQTFELMQQEAEKIHKGTDMNNYKSVKKSKNKLAQLLGNIEKLQFNKLDAVTTVHLDSGKVAAKTNRRELNASLDDLHDFVSTLYSQYDAVPSPPPSSSTLSVSTMSSSDVDSLCKDVKGNENESDNDSISTMSTISEVGDNNHNNESEEDIQDSATTEESFEIVDVNHEEEATPSDTDEVEQHLDAPENKLEDTAEHREDVTSENCQDKETSVYLEDVEDDGEEEEDCSNSEHNISNDNVLKVKITKSNSDVQQSTESVEKKVVDRASQNGIDESNSSIADESIKNCQSEICSLHDCLVHHIEALEKRRAAAREREAHAHLARRRAHAQALAQRRVEEQELLRQRSGQITPDHYLIILPSTQPHRLQSHVVREKLRQKQLREAREARQRQLFMEQLKRQELLYRQQLYENQLHQQRLRAQYQPQHYSSYQRGRSSLENRLLEAIFCM